MVFGPDPMRSDHELWEESCVWELSSTGDGEEVSYESARLVLPFWIDRGGGGINVLALGGLIGG